MTPHDWIVQEQRRQQRRDAGRAFFIIAGVVLLFALSIGAAFMVMMFP